MKGDKRRAVKARQLPLTFTPPCLAAVAAEPPAGKEWVHEVKFDGYRVQALVEAGGVRILTRTGLDWTGRFGVLAEDLAALGCVAAIDGEAVVVDEQGVSRFQMLQAELKKGAGARIQLMAFDLLHLDGRPLAARPLVERKFMLRGALERRALPHGLLRFSDHIAENGPGFLAEACRSGLEGIISKRGDLPYRSGRHGDWTKSKCVLADPFVVIGFTPQKGASGIVGALVLGYYDNGELMYAGRVGTGFTVAEGRAMSAGLAEIRIAAPVLARRLSSEQRRGVTWVRPAVVAQVSYRDVTSDGLLRHASFQHFRDDKPVEEIGRPAAFSRASAGGRASVA